MFPISYRRHRFPPTVIQHAVWLYLHFTLSYRDVEGDHAPVKVDRLSIRWPAALPGTCTRRGIGLCC